MAQGLRPHYSQYYEHSVKTYYDQESSCMVKKLYHERYEYKPPPKKYKSCKVLEKNKKKYSNR